MPTSSSNSEKITIKMDAADLRSLNKAFARMDKDSQVVLRQRVQTISSFVARQMVMEAHVAPNPRQAALVADTIKANKDRIPNITIGGARIAKVSRRATPGSPKPRVGQLLFGSEFGVGRRGVGVFPQGGRKFAARSPREPGGGNRGYWIFPTLRALQPRITRDYHRAVLEILRGWTQ